VVRLRLAKVLTICLSVNSVKNRKTVVFTEIIEVVQPMRECASRPTCQHPAPVFQRPSRLTGAAAEPQRSLLSSLAQPLQARLELGSAGVGFWVLAASDLPLTSPVVRRHPPLGSTAPCLHPLFPFHDDLQLQVQKVHLRSPRQARGASSACESIDGRPLHPLIQARAASRARHSLIAIGGSDLKCLVTRRGKPEHHSLVNARYRSTGSGRILAHKKQVRLYHYEFIYLVRTIH
jgi:hypothetical protein